MSRFRNAVLTVALLAVAGLAAAQSPKYPGVGRAATPKEVAKWDIDVRPDFKGLPAGSGSVAKGQDVWEGKCAHCHGVFGESGEVFSPLIGGTTAEDVKTGRVANLNRSDYPGRTTIMKVATVSTLWDYINRAMPWTAPKSLTTEEVYSVTAFLLNLANVVPDDFVLSDKNIADVQNRMPNRNGMTTKHAMWPGQEFGGVKKPDTDNKLCMKDCTPEPKVASFLPDFARNAHGNLAEQNRLVGQQIGVDTTKPEAKAGMPAAAAPAAAAPAKPENAEAKAAIALLNKYSCTACHGVDKKVVGPGFNEIAKKHAGKVDYLVGKIKAGGSGVWGPIPMPPQTLPDADAKKIAEWISKGASK
ncbi:c-type cytochrome [Limnohabitans lacus]|jgi:S-disulfanyl-L-cysteine oxidoreductase SoxD|uniref:C-type cytochrome n=1 Tax=Limnohabitans lacus TaxID=3045173 RepID=A0ABT6X7J5_9BURK|nr:c-type cytochrome [Limnohabitans sp. HM2-2]MDI9234098.1 c-type cytochrome [Limnohabitans sp. HM2-2]